MVSLFPRGAAFRHGACTLRISRTLAIRNNMRPTMFDHPHDRSLTFLSRPYHFIQRECRRRNTDAFDTSLLLEKTTCLLGADAARMFYSEPALVRHGAAPEPVRATLFGKGGVQELDGPAHRERRALMLGLLGAENVGRLTRRVRRYWGSFDRWAPRRCRLPLYETAQHVLTLSACEWLGVPVRNGDLASLSADVASLFNDAARAGHLKARRARVRLERWLAGLVDEARASPESVDLGPLFQALIAFRDSTTGEPLPPRIVAVEALNLIRPVVAVSVYITWMAHAILRDDALLRRLTHADAALRQAFVEEVRRFYPFFPAVMARVAQPFAWHGHAFEVGTRVMLDIHGTNHDPRHWSDPGIFRPERFLTDVPDSHAFIPQGGGPVAEGHRCPGEPATVAIMLASLEFLLATLPRHRAPIDHGIAARRMPAMPMTRIYIR